MKRSVLIIFLLLTCLSLSAQPHFYQAEKKISVGGGYSNIHMNAGNFHAGYLEGTYYMSSTLAWEFYARVEYGKDYLSFDPAGLLGLPFWIYSSTHHLGRTSNFIGALLSITSAKLPIAIGQNGYFEVTPYWSLLKFTRLYDDRFRVHGDLGLQFKLYPISFFNWYNTLYISGFIQWNWAYSRSNYYGRYNLKNNRSDFFGYTWGVQIGYYF